MFEATLDAWYAWFGVATASVAVLGVALGLTTPAPPAAQPVTDTVDRVASSPHEAYATVSLDATEVRIGTHRIGLRTDGGTGDATVAYPPMTPATEGPLADVLRGEPPEAVFDDEAEFRRATERARDAPREWQPAPERLSVRRVSWGETDATLVG